ncbi:SDR family oxidoreductase [Shewanella sp. WXL01]|uniref:SDR family oxidoreductase n=1 Tax=Shewanella maritima TaxID=2520507 RepID=A0A411PCQ3_9GAMM|nr:MULTISPECIES: SDR family oxidoreductase [Shewanella]NKF50674.1 SDR family oxidoreductase [Shewanella sp. WXL01]QBF81345.1 SDR family oxidoreductase [Shewanella maritima]
MQTVAITGANRGIGLEFARYYQSQGAKVYALCRSSNAELESLGVNVITGAEVTTDQGLDVIAQGLAGAELDILICNAGILRDEQLGSLNIETIKQQFEVNTLAPLLIVERLESQLKSGAKVAMITSRMGSIEDNTSGGRYGYRMSKAALNAASKSLSHDLRLNNVSVGIYHPGYVQTDMVGGRGDISADVAATRIANLIAQLSLQNTGVFYHSNGQQLPW